MSQIFWCIKLVVLKNKAVNEFCLGSCYLVAGGDSYRGNQAISAYLSTRIAKGSISS